MFTGLLKADYALLRKLIMLFGDGSIIVNFKRGCENGNFFKVRGRKATRYHHTIFSLSLSPLNI